MSFPSLSLPAQLPPNLRRELEQVLALITAWMQQNHSDDGTHTTLRFPNGSTLYERFDTTSGVYRLFTTGSNGVEHGPY